MDIGFHRQTVYLLSDAVNVIHLLYGHTEKMILVMLKEGVLRIFALIVAQI